ncbi:putative surface protein [Gardnerella vaginalis 6119V5]|uniref:SpaH/EbpB family LPXTG-anchored major pilin n=1 Tax=Gardnerella vaginalis TaxID=2702 RepID=UPI0002634083|nr:SpaH/EbpB family LPXTG-anchored major pilin [Gardnerella vaginalis]EIK87618.1 putative surface protein [Gardnerella vaginalis 6119V5]
MNKFTKQCVAAVASLAMAGTLCVAGAVVAGSSAWATPSVDTSGTKGTTGVDNPSATADYKVAPWNTGAPSTGSITIYKWKDEVAEGKQKKETPVKGAGFTIKKVKSIGSTTLDLTKYSDWSEIAKNVKQLNNGEITTGTEANKLKVAFDESFGTSGSLSGDTNADGVVKFKDLPLGLYRVWESTVPKGYSAAEGGKAFYMTLPMIEKVTQQGGAKTETKYNYAPFVDPKNVDLSGAVTKTQDLTHTVGAGDTIEYTIKAKLDKSKAATTSENVNPEEFKGYTVYDLAPDGYFDKYDSSVVTEVKVGDTDLKPVDGKTYYNVGNPTDIAAPADSSDVARKKISITFTDDGNQKLADEVNKADNVGKFVYVSVKFTFKLKDSTTLGAKKVTNKASILPSHKPGSTVPDEIPSDNPPSTEFATFKIKKVSSKDDSALGGAKFRLFAVKTDAEGCTNAIKAGTTGEDLDKVCKNKSSAGFGEKETSSDNDTSKKGLTDGYSVKRGEAFYVVETVAPTGYIRNPDVHEFTLDKNKTEDTLTVKNIPDSGNGGKGWLFNLPKTGAAGVVIFALAGVCLVCFGIFVFMRNRKKDEEQQAA